MSTITPRCKVGDLAFVIAQDNLGAVVRVVALADPKTYINSPGADPNLPVWAIVSEGGPLHAVYRCIHTAEERHTTQMTRVYHDSCLRPIRPKPGKKDETLSWAPVPKVEKAKRVKAKA